MLEQIIIKEKLNKESNKYSISEQIRNLEILMSQKNIDENSENEILKLYNDINYTFLNDSENISNNDHNRFNRIKELFKKEHKNKKTSTASIISSTSKIQDLPHMMKNLTINTSHINDPKLPQKITELTDDHKTEEYENLKKIFNTAIFQDIHYDIFSAKDPTRLKSPNKDIKKSNDFSISTSEKHLIKEIEIPFFCTTSYQNSKEYFQEFEIHKNRIIEKDLTNSKSKEKIEEQALDMCMSNFKRRQADYIKNLNIVYTVKSCEILFKECFTDTNGSSLSQHDQNSSVFRAKEILKLSKILESQLLNLHFQMGWSLEKIMSETQTEDTPDNMIRRVRTILAKATQLRNAWNTHSRENILNYLKDQRIKPIEAPGSNTMFTIPEAKLAPLPARFLIPSAQQTQKEEILNLYNLPNKIKQCGRALHENKKILIEKNRGSDSYFKAHYTLELTTNLSQLMKNYAEIEAKLATITQLGLNLEPKYQKLLLSLRQELVTHWKEVLPTSQDRQTFNNKLLGIKPPTHPNNSHVKDSEKSTWSLRTFR